MLQNTYANTANTTKYVLLWENNVVCKKANQNLVPFYKICALNATIFSKRYLFFIVERKKKLQDFFVIKIFFQESITTTV